jgi:hypothetical protein
MVQTREELINHLTEAAELEHGLLCQYLFAAYSMKKHHTSEQITPAQAELVREWEAHILGVAREEMAHLGTVSNLLSAIGGAPQFGRPNFPQRSYYFPSESGEDCSYVEFKLEKFSDSSLRRFVRFEAPVPECEDIAEGIAPEPPTYDTVGDLYEKIKQGFINISEQELFIGPRSAQDVDDWARNMKLFTVTDRVSALKAIDCIIEQGEGPPTRSKTQVEDPQEDSPLRSHYHRFKRIREQLAAEKERDPDFDPARQVAPNPLTQPHRDSSGEATIITHPGTLKVAELFNAVYGTMILMLMHFYSFADESKERRERLRASIRQIMSSAVRPLGEILTEMPVSKDAAEQKAGPGFEFYTDLRLPHQTRNRWIIFRERLAQEAAECERISSTNRVSPRFAMLHENFEVLVRTVEDIAKLKGL